MNNKSKLSYHGVVYFYTEDDNGKRNLLAKHNGGTLALAKLFAYMLVGQDTKELVPYELNVYDAGGAPILGLKGAVLKIHGNSKATEVYHAIHRAVDYVDNDITGMIAEAIANSEEFADKGE